MLKLDRQARGRSVDDALTVAISLHEAAETVMLHDYAQLAANSAHPTIRALMRFLLDDETLHHRRFNELASMLREAATEESDSLTAGAVAHQQELQTELDTLRDALMGEQASARNLHELALIHSELGGGTASLVLELIACDCRKHALLVEYALQRLQSR